MTRGAGELRKGYISEESRGEVDVMGEMNHYAAFCVATLFSFISQQTWVLNICYKTFSPCKINVGESCDPERQYASDNTVCVDIH
jgi:hypothetical protein